MTLVPDRLTILQGDCRETLKTLPDASIDACVTDPPYELGFMGKAWDKSGVAYDVETWREVLRVLKLGGHLLSFGGTRTYHRMACAIEDAGFEIRDQIGWCYGSGFPKSMDVAKAIDKARTEDLEPIRAVCRTVRAAMDARALKSRDLVQNFGGCDARLIDHWAARDTDSQPSLPTWQQWKTLCGLFPELNEHDAEAWRLNGRKGKPGDAWNEAEILGEHEGVTPGFVGMRFNAADKTIREPSDAAKQWDGWGTALKPAWEPICVARKPLIGTVANNVLQHGTGALNIDGCRIEAGDSEWTAKKSPTGTFSQEHRPWKDRLTGDEVVSGGKGGRWPANLIHDGSDEVVALFPAKAGAAAPVTVRNGDKFRNAFGAFKGDIDEQGSTFHGDSGSAARFFYCAKVSPSERGDSKHPTMKPVALMRYLCRLVTPPGGTVLDPFGGSGSTAAAALQEGFNVILCELNPEYVSLIHQRCDPLLAPKPEPMPDLFQLRS